MNKFIVITTIQAPTEATIKFSNFEDWQLIVVGDLKTPHEEYKKINCIYLTPEFQEQKYKDLSDAIGWNSIQRRNIGFIEAYRLGAEIIATVDDDNIPYDNWGEKLFVNNTIQVDTFDCVGQVAEPLSVTNHKELWHRGFPLQLLKDKNNIEYVGKTTRKVLIQADLWDGDPDVDAICRITKKPIVKFDTEKPFCFTKISPFNSQNTFLSREVIPFYCMIPHIGRMDDIWASYMIQETFKENLIYAPATVYQKRNEQDLIRNMENEILGYRNTLKFINKTFQIPETSMNAYKQYRRNFDV